MTELPSMVITKYLSKMMAIRLSLQGSGTCQCLRLATVFEFSVKRKIVFMRPRLQVFQMPLTQVSVLLLPEISICLSWRALNLSFVMV